MTDKELDIIMQICFLIHDTESLQRMVYEELSLWVARQIHMSLNISACPIGSSYLANCSEDMYLVTQGNIK